MWRSASRRHGRGGIPPWTTPGWPPPRSGRSRRATFAPELFAIHPTYVHEAEEEIVFLADAFLSHIPEATCDVPVYRSWVDTQDFGPAYRWLHRMLQLLQWQKRRRGEPVRPFVLKTPADLGYLEALLAEFPDAHVVHSHRTRSRSSRRAPRSTPPCGGRTVARSTPTRWVASGSSAWDGTCDRPWRPGNHSGRTGHRVAFVDAMADPVGTAGGILSAVGLGPSEDSVACMRSWMEQDRKREALPVHRYTPEDFGLTAAQIRERFDDYSRRFL